ncbi:hypothetical protein [Paenibacillus sp. YIM B09110]|uniref:hypothetical protein n=1 Tax=Paenibacillus sp. YIM B09110 TaxID=3126102 RepID=UPI00301C1E3E
MLNIEVKEGLDGKFNLYAAAPSPNSPYAKRWPYVLNEYLNVTYTSKDEAESAAFFAEKYYELGRNLRR